MPALQSFINNYKNSRKPKVFALLRGEGSGTTPTSGTPQRNVDIIDIKDTGKRHSLDFNGGKPDHFESDILDSPVWQRGAGQTESPQVKLDIDLAPEALTDWFAANFPRHEAPLVPFLEEETASMQRSRNPSQSVMPDPTAFNGHTRLLTGDADEDDELARSSEEVLANLQALDASHFGSLPGFAAGERSPPSAKKQLPSPLSISPVSPQSGARKQPRDSISMLTSNLSLEEPSSAVSGTTLARALFSNSFSLSSDSRSSRYRSGGAGLTRSDSTTLGRGFSFYDTFAVDPDAPPMPAHAESQYEAPKKPRRKQLKRRSSTGSLHPKSLPDTPSATRPNSLLLSPGSEFDILRSPDPWSPPPVPSIPRSPPPLSPMLLAPSIIVEENVLPTSTSEQLTPQSDSLRRLPDPQTPPESSRSSVPSFTASTDSQASSRGSDDVLGYYGVADSYGTPESPLLVAGASFRPAVSPIREETSSQLSPPTPYRNDRRDSRRMLPFGARSPGSASSQRSSMGRGELSAPSRRPSEAASTASRQVLPPLTEGVSTSRLDSPRSSVELLQPYRNDIINRQRSGSAPTPSLIERSLSDPASLTSPQRSASEDLVASRDSPGEDMFISSTSGSSIIHDASTGPLATQLRSSSQPNLAQHLLISRAGSTGRHSRQLSGNRVQGTGVGLQLNSSSRRIGESLESSGTGTSMETQSDHSREDPPHREVDGRFLAEEEMSRSPSRGTISDTSSLHVSDSSRSKLKSLPRIPITPIGLSLSTEDTSSPEPSASSTHESVTQTSQPTTMAASQLNHSPSPIENTTPVRPRVPPNLAIPGSSIGPSTSTQSNDNHYPHQSPILSSQEIELTGGIPPHLRQYKDDFGTYRGLSLGSPPPYYSVINDVTVPPHQQHPLSTPITTHVDTNLSLPIGPSNANQESHQSEARASLRDSRNRPRPPLPAGPRRPSGQLPPPTSNSPFGGRDRSGSVSSTAAVQPAAGPSRLPVNESPVAAISPKFQTPPPRWRGYTLEAAKWTFSSTELQSIVSRAIRQSAQASSVRLLQPDVLDHHVPQEMRRLEAQRTEIKTRYKVLTRRRTLLFEALSAHLSGAAEEDPAYAQRLLEDLREMAITLDRFSEELHSLDGQIAQLDALMQTHTSSALAMALRKLNTSFLKQMAQNQDLEGQLRGAEAERDEAWKQAQWVAEELDQMADVVELESPASNRSSRATSNRKSSNSHSKAGLRTSRRFSQMSTYSFSSIASSKSPISRPERVPPVPALPSLPRKNLPEALMTSPITSASPLSPGYTPTSETRAQHQVQDELYAMLGLAAPEHSLRRSRSWNGLASPPATADPSKAPHLAPVKTLEAQMTRVSRRSSLPPDSTLAQVYNAMAADRNAMLITADMLATTD